MSRVLATAALGVALALAAAIFDTPSLYPPGVALAALALVAVAWVRLAARGAQLTRTPGPATVMEEEPYPLRLQIRTGVLSLPGGELLEPLLGWPVPVGGRRPKRVRINVRFSRRGRRRLAPPTLVIRDPLHLAAREVMGEDGGDVLVLPRIEPVSAAGGGDACSGARALRVGERGASGTALDGSTAELELDGLRPYRTGSPASRIAWPAVARSGEMLERRLVADADSTPLVVLDPSRPASEEHLDMAVRAAASLCVHLARAGGCAVLLPGERRPFEIRRDLGAWPPVHARLALVEAGGPPALARAPRQGALFWVSASARREPAGSLGRGRAARYLVTPVPQPGYPTVFTVAGCSGQRLERAPRRQPAAGRDAA